eukprot:c1215_g1_i1.p1 GENE.c1215_g1_i1~~c1215_g1_i1.p1  ORF type:complete len:173 (+),score=24.06 c1215_g1_i1:72-521(+)
MTSLRPAYHPLSIACVCASNQNRSMEAHQKLLEHGFRVTSFGTNSVVKLPGTAPDKPLTFEFGTHYLEIHKELRLRNMDFYALNGVLGMLVRNSQIKPAPERFQLQTKLAWDIVIAFEPSVYLLVVEGAMHTSYSTHIMARPHTILVPL